MSVINLTENGGVKDDFDYEDACWLGEEETDTHAPTTFVSECLIERERRRKRDLNELQDLWREEMLARKRERASMRYRPTRCGGDAC